MLKLKSISVEMKGMASQGTRSLPKEVRVYDDVVYVTSMGVVSAKGKSVPTNRTLPNDAFSLHVLQALFGVSRPGQSGGESVGPIVSPVRLIVGADMS